MIHFLIHLRFSWLEVGLIGTAVFFAVDIVERRARRRHQLAPPPERWVDVIDPHEYFGGTVRVLDTRLDQGLE